MRVLLLNQTFWPDVASSGQHLKDLALGLRERGHEVTVVTSRRAYDDPARLFPKRETWQGIRIIRIGSTGFGKAAKWRRAADFGSFLLACMWRLAWLPKHDVVLAMTSPPLISFIGAWLARFWRASFVYWVMDFNPDEAIAAGWLRVDSMAAKVLEFMSRFSLRRARKVIALDRYMRDRIVAKGISPEKVAVLAPWSHDDEVRFDAAGRERFRKKHGLEGKFVVMYSGNHSPVHPLDTLLKAAESFREDRDIVFCFVGGGSEWRRIKEESKKQKVESRNWEGAEEESRKQKVESRKGEGAENPKNEKRKTDLAPLTSHLASPTSHLICLPYQPLDELAGSLSAADMHVVVMGEPMVGTVHPCKVYNALKIGKPLLYIGPRPSHLTDLLDALGDSYPWAAAGHDEPNKVVEAINHFRQKMPASNGSLPNNVLSQFSKESILPKMIAVLETA